MSTTTLAGMQTTQYPSPPPPYTAVSDNSMVFAGGITVLIVCITIGSVVALLRMRKTRKRASFAELADDMEMTILSKRS